MVAVIHTRVIRVLGKLTTRVAKLLDSGSPRYDCDVHDHRDHNDDDGD